MSEQENSYSLRMRELDIREKEIKNERILGIVKIFTTGVVVTLIPAILTHWIKQQELEIQTLKQKQELEIQTLKGEIDYLKQFSDKVVERDDLTKRRNFVQYLATVAHSEDSRNRWNKYFNIVDADAKKQEEIEKDIFTKNAEAKDTSLPIKILQLDKKRAG